MHRIRSDISPNRPLPISTSKRARLGTRLLAAGAIALLLQLALALPAWGQSEIPDDNFNPVGGSIPDDIDVEDTEAPGGPGPDGADRSAEEAQAEAAQEAAEAGGEGAQPMAPQPKAATSTRRTTPRRSATTRRAATTSQNAATSVVPETEDLPDPSLSPSPSPTPSLSPLTTPSPTPSPFFSRALDDDQKTSDEGGSTLPLLIALLLALGIVFMAFSSRKKRRFARGGHGARRYSTRR